MTNRLTARLLNVRAIQRSVWPSRLAVVADRLHVEYGTPSLGNFRDPVREVFYILLSAKTADARYRETFRTLFARFRTLDQLAAAPVADIRECIASGGLADKRAPQIKRTAAALQAAGGRRPNRFLRSLGPEAAYHFLLDLPGMGPKSALCVIMYSLGADVLPADVNVQRVAERMGAIPSGLSHYQAQRRLAAVAPDGHSRRLHIGMVVHGRRVCLPRLPRCGSCVLRDLCRTGRRTLEANHAV